MIEDDFMFRKTIKKFLKAEVTSNFSVFNFNILEVNDVIPFYNGLSNITIEDFDIFVIDIDLKIYVDGLDFGKKIRKQNQNCKIIYLTSVEDRAIQIINENIIPEAYLMKSSNLEITKFKLQDILKQIESDFIHQEIAEKSIIFNSQNINHFVLIDDILYLKVLPGLKNSILLKTRAKEIIIEGLISEIKKMLPSSTFILNLKSYIIHKNNIDAFSLKEGMITFYNNEKLYLSPKLINKIKKNYE
ncbi:MULTISPECIES: LytTR family transcriptional regulator DNA-binding domain-containing protein [unclassified Enterococcus]|uniref:LytR/AlgR family response regulator transcription factor n=1 Tax=unclassified Enterococcus TaxID=2608891 RepID=UPI001553E70B|nr:MULTISPECIES: LytTR family transcriptional regulator DNA-binding domain-containing protein [unclassified Enterococcus]MBS7577454.1 response regulator transcription factor [Enterococcus sp. MMGLQ5-2]MBS7584860.1 response regulator transcription factor [Enterococcus sp. MMGLQ5-1]NPD12715.1 response regulator transcription factor [Enterococcus sp. MMGLQ5-1]NPD37286.1 response regulator transcription factor [Enterococcus sp. MMGLQ5-2]